MIFVAASQGDAQKALGKFLYFSLFKPAGGKGAALRAVREHRYLLFWRHLAFSVADASPLTWDIKRAQARHGCGETNIYSSSIADNKHTADALSRELVKADAEPEDQPL